MFPLLIYISLDHLKIDSDSGDKVSSWPERFLRKHFLVSVSIVNFNSRFSFEFSHDIANGILWSYSTNHVNVIRSDISFDDFKVKSLSELLQYSSEIFSDSLKKNAFSIFWNYHDVECAVPLRVRLGIIGAMRHKCFMVMSLIGIYAYSRTYEYTQIFVFCEL